MTIISKHGRLLPFEVEGVHTMFSNLCSTTCTAASCSMLLLQDWGYPPLLLHMLSLMLTVYPKAIVKSSTYACLPCAQLHVSNL